MGKDAERCSHLVVAWSGPFCDFDKPQSLLGEVMDLRFSVWEGGCDLFMDRFARVRS